MPAAIGLAGLVVNVLTARAIKLFTATRVIFFIVAVTVAAGTSARRVPAIERAPAWSDR